jgi:hypothetical protein
MAARTFGDRHPRLAKQLLGAGRAGVHQLLSLGCQAQRLTERLTPFFVARHTVVFERFPPPVIGSLDRVSGQIDTTPKRV